MRKLNRFFSLMRLIHLYVSSALFILLVFFCFTGITLNHTEWLDGSPTQGEAFEPLPEDFPLYSEEKRFTWLEAANDHLQQAYGLSKPRAIEWDEEMKEVIFDYPVPAGYAAVTINYLDGSLYIDFQKGNVWHVLNDLHKGRHSGEAWSWVIDLSAVLMLVFALSGLVILYQNRSKRKAGNWLLLGGALAPLALYLTLVPSLSGL